MTPKVSVIIPNYNYARYLPQRIDSILNQTYQDFEIIILDDCSTDNSREVIEQYRTNPKVSQIVYGETNSGSPFKQWEKGLHLARGKYAWIAEADDLAEPTFLERGVEAMESDQEIVLVKMMSKLIDGEGKMSKNAPFEKYPANKKIYIYGGNGFIRHYMLRENFCYNASMMLLSVERWRELDDRRYLKMRYAGDWLFWGLMLRDHKIAEVREKLNKFRFHGGSVTDEGKRLLKQPAAECEILKAVLANELPDEPTGYRILRSYNYHKVYNNPKHAGLVKEITRLQPDFWDYVNMPDSKTFPWIWMYKHFIWPFERSRWDKKVAGGLEPEKIIDSRK